MYRSRNALLGLALLSLPFLFTLDAVAQERVVVSKEVAVGRSVATLVLEFSDGAELALGLEDGSVMIDGDVVGSYEAGDPLEAAWRTLLGEAVALDDGPLSQRLRDWAPEASLDGEGLSLATRLDRALETALSAPAPALSESDGLSLSPGDTSDGALLKLLMGQTSRLAVLGEALEGLGSDINLHIDEDVTVAEGEVVEGSLIVVQGNARIEGTVRGDVVLVDGNVVLLDGGRIEGDVRLADADFDDDGGTLRGDVVDLLDQERDVESEIRARLRDELRSEVRRELRSGQRDSGYSFFRPVGGIFRGVGGLLENLVAILILGIVGMGIVAFAPDNLNVVAETARRAPGRSAMVGLAGSFLLIPVWVLGTVALAVSIVGIPVMIAWIPLFPLAAVAAGILGYLAMARNVGEWLADSDLRYTDWIRKSNPVTTVFGGVAGLMLFFMAADVLGILPFFGFFTGLLRFAGTMLALVALQVGFGAVLLTRAGRRPEYPRDLDEAWARVSDLDVDIEADAGAGAAQDGGA